MKHYQAYLEVVEEDELLRQDFISKASGHSGSLLSILEVRHLGNLDQQPHSH